MVSYTHRLGYVRFDFGTSNNKKGFVTIEHRTVPAVSCILHDASALFGGGDKKVEV